MSRRTVSSNRNCVDAEPLRCEPTSLSGDQKHQLGSALGSHSLREEWKSLVLLTALYILQGVPLGMGSAFPILLQNRGASYRQQALFSLVLWPFSVKLLWAPIVDSLYVKSFGRRKSWAVPVQYLIGLFLVFLSWHVNDWLRGNGAEPDVYHLTAVFLVLTFLAATQDIAVDGWALSMLSRRNVAHASTCNTVGQTAGYFIGHVGFLTLESKDFVNRFVYSEPQTTGLVTISGFMRFWAVIFFAVTTLVALFKQERGSDAEHHMRVAETYRVTLRVLWLPAVRTLALFLLTCKMAFGITDGVTGLKLIEAGVPQQNLALLTIPLTPLQIMLPFFLSRYITGDDALNVFLKAYPFRLLFGFVFAAVVWWSFSLRGNFSYLFYCTIVFLYGLHQVLVYSCFVALMAFFARVSDPVLGGTYMTLLNTLSNLGGNWPSTLSTWMLDYTTRKQCSVELFSCSSKDDQERCQELGGECFKSVDGYYIESMVSVAIGFMWYFCYGRATARYIQRLQPHDFLVPR